MQNETVLTEIARAKINLTLHVARAITEQSDPFAGYHPLDSLVVFADIGDVLRCEPSDKTRLSIDGEFADIGINVSENLIMHAVHAVEAHTAVPPLHFTLIKNLPPASGIGGGSADAAAALRLLSDYVELKPGAWHKIAVSLGADVPICLASATGRMTGIGDSISPLPGRGLLHAVLVNPRIDVPTRDVFRKFDALEPKDTPRPQQNMHGLLECALSGRNDLEPAAKAICPEIGDVLLALREAPGCALSRMSGSGATCFGVFGTAAEAEEAAMAISGNHENWWVKTATLGEAD